MRRLPPLLVVLCCALGTPAAAATLPNGGSVTGTISVASPEQSWTFDGLAGERAWLKMADVNGGDPNRPGDIDPRFYLYAPDGTLVDSDTYDDRVAVMSNVRLPVDGPYTVVVSDSPTNGDDVGPYELFFAKVSGAQEHGGLVNGGSIAERIDLGDIDSYTFHGRTGERVSLAMADLHGGDPNLPGDLDPQLYLYGPDDVPVALDSYDDSVAWISDTELPLDGTYTVIVSDSPTNGDDTGPYELFFARAPGAREHGELVSGTSVTEHIDLGDIDSYTFHGAWRDRVSLTMTDLAGGDPNLPGDIDPRLYLYGPTGALVAQDTYDASAASVTNIELPVDGPYTVVVSDSPTNGDDAGPYSLSFTSTGGNAPPAPSTPRAPAGSGNPPRPALSWAPVGFSSWYLVWVQDLSGNVLLRRWYRASDAGCAAASAECTAVLPISIVGDARYWVGSWNAFGFGPWSAESRFSTVSGTPVASTPVAPIGSSDSRTPRYEWARVPNASWYRVWVDDATGGRLRQWVTAGQAGCAAPGQDCSYRFPTSVSGAASWWVRSWNSDGSGPWSARADFES